MAHGNIIERAEMCWVFDKELRRRGTEVLALNVSKYLRKLESNDGSPLKGLRGAGFFTEDCGGAGVRDRATAFWSLVFLKYLGFVFENLT